MATSRRRLSNRRESDTVARSGGGEFVVRCPATATATAQHLIDRLRRRTPQQQSMEMRSIDDRSETSKVHFSLGCADSSQCPPKDVVKLAGQRR